MSMESETLAFVLTHAKDNLELVSIPFRLAGGAVAMDVTPVMFLQAEAVRLAVKGYLSDDNPKEKEVKDLMDVYLSDGNKLYLCSPCLKERNISEDQLIDGAVTVGAAKCVAAILEARGTLCY